MIIKVVFVFLYTRAKLFINKLHKKKQCYVCGEQFWFFNKYNGGVKKVNSFLLHLNMIGSDLNNFECLYCGAHDRERHLYMFFDKLCFWDKMFNSRILHFAPEKNLQHKILQFNPCEYVKADFHPLKKDVLFVDATNITFADEKFDIVIANHVLEHIKNYHKALTEIFRVLKFGGVAILQTPYSSMLKNNFEDTGIDTKEAKIFFYGQQDHVRIFSEIELHSCIKEVGFNLKVIKHSKYYSLVDADYYGVNEAENLLFAIKE